MLCLVVDPATSDCHTDNAQRAHKQGVAGHALASASSATDCASALQVTDDRHKAGSEGDRLGQLTAASLSRDKPLRATNTAASEWLWKCIAGSESYEGESRELHYYV